MKRPIVLRLDRSAWEGASYARRRRRVCRALRNRAARERCIYELVILFDRPAKEAVCQIFRFDGR